MTKETKNFQIKSESVGENGLVVLWEQSVPPSKRDTWKVSVGGTFHTFQDQMKAFVFYWEEKFE